MSVEKSPGKKKRKKGWLARLVRADGEPTESRDSRDVQLAATEGKLAFRIKRRARHVFCSEKSDLRKHLLLADLLGVAAYG